MTKFSDVPAAGITIRESADDGSDFTNPDADYRRLFLGEDGALHLKDSAGTVTDVSAAFVGASYATAVGQSIANNAAAAIVDFGTSVYDTDSAVTTGASWKFTAPSTGYYMVNVHVSFAATTTWAAGERGWLQLLADGSVVNYLDRKDNFSNANEEMHLQGSAVVYLVATHYIDVRLVQNSGGALALSAYAENNWIQVTKVG